MKTELIKIKDLSNDPANVRKHDERVSCSDQVECANDKYN